MTRSIDRMSESLYDLVVVGGGIHGAFVAWDGAQRGLKVALIEQADFAGATSGNSQRIIHGGLRYLQEFDLKRARESALERQIFMRIAPHFIRPLPCLLAMERGREVNPVLLSMGLRLYGLLAHVSDPAQPLPLPRRVSGPECVRLCPELASLHPSAGILFHDGHARDATRLVLSVLRSASRAGADIANYVRVMGPLRSGQSLAGVRVADMLSKRRFDIRARILVNCSGPWSEHVSGLLGGRTRHQSLLKAIVLATRPIVREFALGVPAKPQKLAQRVGSARGRFLFFTPARSVSLLGTFYASYSLHPDELTVTMDEIADIVAEINSSFPAAELRMNDVRRVYTGLLPAEGRSEPATEPVCARRYSIHDDGAFPGDGVVSVVGVKLSTARAVAARAVDHVVKRLGIRSAPCRTHEEPLFEATAIAPRDLPSTRRAAQESGVSEAIADHVVDTYGSACESVLRHVREDSRWAHPVSSGSNVIGAQVVHAARLEMAQRLSDVVFRRTDLGASATPDPASLRACASILSSELGWTQARTQEEIAEVESARIPCR